MNVWIETPASNGLSNIHRPDDPEGVLAVRSDLNPLSGGSQTAVAAAARPGRLVMWSGTLAEELFAAHPGNWMPAGRAALDAWLDRFLPEIEAVGVRLVIQPHARHILSDVPSTLRFFQDHGGKSIDLALAPACLLEASMLPRIEDHLERICCGLGPASTIVILQDVLPGAAGEPPRPAPLGRGIMPGDPVRSLLRQHVPPQTPVVLAAEDRASQFAWLGITDR